MKLPVWRSTTRAILLAGTLCLLAGFARQDAPSAGQAAPATAGAATQPATQPSTRPADNRSPEEKRTAMIEAIRTSMDLPPQNDTGTPAPDVLLPVRASTTAASTDGVMWYINWVTIIFSVLILGLMAYFAFFRYRRRSDDEPDPENVSTHSTTLELTWTIIPTCIVLIMFTLGFKDFLSQTVSPPGAYEVQVTGRMWSWQFTYPNGSSTEDLHVPRDRPVRFVLSSSDTLHSLFIPAFRVKKDVVPGRFNRFWATPTKEGIYEVFCTEYCGTNHSRMIAKCFVYPPERYEEILARISNPYFDFVTNEPNPPEVVGAALARGRGCQSCHSTDGSILQAPSWKNLYGAARTLMDGSSVTADDEYIRQSILQPQARVVQGYGPSSAMPSYAGQLSDRDIQQIVAYIRSLSDDQKPVGQTGTTVGPGESQSIGGPEKARGLGPGGPRAD